MPRRERLDFKDAIHYASVHGRAGADIFFNPRRFRQIPQARREDAPGVLRFESLLGETCQECGTLLYAYCVEPNSATLVLRTTGLPLKAFMQQLCGGYSRYLHTDGLMEGNSAFRARYDAKVVAPEYLRHAVRRAHRSPVVSGLCNRPVDYPFSSERAYLGEAAALPLDMSGVQDSMKLRGFSGVRGYREFMDKDETPFVAKLLSKGSPLDARIAGDDVFVQKARLSAAHPPEPPTRDQLVDSVARLLDKTPDDILSATHVGALGRALVAWYGRRMGAATLTEMGRWFSVTGSTLAQGIRHHRSVSPELFSLAALPGFETRTDAWY
jgi:putative transposase